MKARPRRTTKVPTTAQERETRKPPARARAMNSFREEGREEEVDHLARAPIRSSSEAADEVEVAAALGQGVRRQGDGA